MDEDALYDRLATLKADLGTLACSSCRKKLELHVSDGTRPARLTCPCGVASVQRDGNRTIYSNCLLIGKYGFEGVASGIKVAPWSLPYEDTRTKNRAQRRAERAR